MFCPSCGNEVNDQANYCEKCGMELKERKTTEENAMKKKTTKTTTIGDTEFRVHILGPQKNKM